MIRHLFTILIGLGPLGLFVLGVLDSSFLFAPTGNDVLVTILVARHHAMLPVYVLAASSGSTLGVLLVDLVLRKRGEEGLKKLMNDRRLAYLKCKIAERAATMLCITCLAPPPFPFTPVIAAAAAFQYPRKRLLTVVFIGRIVRFSLVGALAILFGRQILLLEKRPEFLWFVAGLTVVCVAGSVFSITRWVRISRSKDTRSPAQPLRAR